jgi:hypothetical protein
MMDRQKPRTPKGFNLNRVFIAITLVMLISSCAERESLQVVMPDSTIVFPSKDSNDISAKITFSSRLSQKTGKQSAIKTVFALEENADVYAVVDFQNRPVNSGNELMVHLDWVGPDGKSVYLKRTDLAAGDSTSTLISSISVSPGNRMPGEYKLRVYLFRELIAEKQFELRPETEVEKPSAAIIFYKSLDKETGVMNGVDTVFEIKKKGILRAQVSISGTGVYKDDELPLHIEWFGPDGKDFYSKKIEFVQSDSVAAINTSISITPDKREPGEYFLRIYLFDDVVGEQSFVLLPAE